MKYLATVALLVVLMFAGWPYLTVYNLDIALKENDEQQLAELIDLPAVRQQITDSLKRDVDTALGKDNGRLLGWIKDQVNELGHQAIAEVIDLNWMKERLLSKGPFSSNVTYAFFESWDRFLVRLGDLGEEPVHIRFLLRHWQWQVTAIYD